MDMKEDVNDDDAKYSKQNIKKEEGKKKMREREREIQKKTFEGGGVEEGLSIVCFGVKKYTL